MGGTYDIHTNIMMYPKIMQPTVARWERVEPEPDEATRQRRITSARTALANKDTDGDIDMNGNETTEKSTQSPSPDSDSSQLQLSDKTIFPPVPSLYSRNFTIHDIHLESAPDSTLGNPGPAGHTHDIGNPGIIKLSDKGKPAFTMPPEVLAELPPECREAYVEAAAREYEWKSRWRGEKEDGLRAKLPFNFAWS